MDLKTYLTPSERLFDFLLAGVSNGDGEDEENVDDGLTNEWIYGRTYGLTNRQM